MSQLWPPRPAVWWHAARSISILFRCSCHRSNSYQYQQDCRCSHQFSSVTANALFNNSVWNFSEPPSQCVCHSGPAARNTMRSLHSDWAVQFTQQLQILAEVFIFPQQWQSLYDGLMADLAAELPQMPLQRSTHLSCFLRSTPLKIVT